MILRGEVASDVLTMHTGINVLTPDSIKENDPYRVVYLLHGLHGDQNTWLDKTMLPVFANDYNAVFVMPAVGRSFYTDMKYGQKFFTYVSEELPELCRKVFNISGRREDTAVMGCSMGGYGALKCSLSRPEQYGFCGAISSACLYSKEQLDGLRKDPTPWLKHGGSGAEAIYRDFIAIFGEDLRPKPETEITEMVKKIQAGPVKPKIYAVCGTEDSLCAENRRFRADMEKLPFDFTYEEWPGVHDWYFFNDGLKKALGAWYA
ncbi:MAG: esterase family protein [Treponema sp.]|jgi:S-formylglutathione hydrolase FrmB|nr:esterase family protein [Treponema sp.]